MNPQTQYPTDPVLRMWRGLQPRLLLSAVRGTEVKTPVHLRDTPVSQPPAGMTARWTRRFAGDWCACLLGVPAREAAALQEAAAREFRPSAFHMDGSMQTVSLVLCNDKPQTFGAPDVLRLSLDQLAVKYMMDMRFHDRPPDQV